ncbi:MAG: hypothetical protein AAF694_28235 [Bacteroidota bacterium]
MNSLRSIFVIALCFFASAAMAQSVVGDWKTEAPMQDGTIVEVKFTLSEDGTYSVDMGMDGIIEVKGKYEVNGNEMIIHDTEGPQACPPEAKGIYSAIVEGETLMIERVKDECEGRGNTDGVMHFSKM